MVRAQHPLQIGQQLPGQPDGLAEITDLSCPGGYADPRPKRLGMSFTNFGCESLFPASPPQEVLDRNHRSPLAQARDDARILSTRPQVLRFHLSRITVEWIGRVMSCPRC